VIDSSELADVKLIADRDSARWKLSNVEVQKRRAFFWELFITDCWMVRCFGCPVESSLIISPPLSI